MDDFIRKLLEPDAALLDVFWANILTAYEISTRDDDAATALLQAIAEHLGQEPPERL